MSDTLDRLNRILEGERTPDLPAFLVTVRDEIGLYRELHDACMDMTYADAVSGAESWDRMQEALKSLQTKSDGSSYPLADSSHNEDALREGTVEIRRMSEQGCDHTFVTARVPPGDRIETYCIRCGTEKGSRND